MTSLQGRRRRRQRHGRPHRTGGARHGRGTPGTTAARHPPSLQGRRRRRRRRRRVTRRFHLRLVRRFIFYLKRKN